MTRRVEITVSEETWGRLEAARGHEPRASFVKRALESALGLPSQGDAPGGGGEIRQKGVSTPAPSRASAKRFEPYTRELKAPPPLPNVTWSSEMFECPHGRCSERGPLGEPCPVHPNLKFKEPV